MMLNEDYFDLDSKEVSLSSLEETNEHVEPEIITDFDQFEEMSLSVQKKNKEALSALKTKVMYSLDKRKLKEAQKLITGLENIGDMFSDPEIVMRVRDSVSSAMDLKFLSEAYAKMVDSQQKLMRLDSVDGQGTARRLNIGVRYEDETGTKLNTVISVGDNNG